MTELPDGWLSKDDVAELRRLANGAVVLELGAWKGRSTTVLSEVASYVVSVDRHRGIPSVDETDSLPDYIAAVRPLPNVAMVVASFTDIVPLLQVGAFDLVFIDGDHEEAPVQRDIILAVRLEPPVIAMHDWDFPEVASAGRILLGDPDNVRGSVASFRRK